MLPSSTTTAFTYTNIKIMLARIICSYRCMGLHALLKQAVYFPEEWWGCPAVWTVGAVEREHSLTCSTALYDCGNIRAQFRFLSLHFNLIKFTFDFCRYKSTVHQQTQLYPSFQYQLWSWNKTKGKYVEVFEYRF